MTHKEEAKLCHTIAVLISLLADYTDDLTPSGAISKEFKEKALELMPLSEQMLQAAYNVKEVSSSTYINDLSNKIDTVIRHNFTRIV
jgi:hypothetical protein